MGATRARLWRKKAKRGVSPIIATILLVAITVVLAAVLYVLISGLTKGPGNTPIGSALAVSSATASTGGTGATAWYNETISIQTASSGVTANSIKLQLVTSGGQISGTTFTGTLVDVSGCQVAFYQVANGWTATLGTYPAGVAHSNLCASLTATSQISSGDQLVIETTSTGGSLSGAGNSLNIIGTGSYSGSVAAAIP